MLLLVIIIVALVLLFAVKQNRIRFVSAPTFRFFEKALPPLSDTEKQAMESGDVWFEGELFQGSPNWQKFHQLPSARLSDAEKDFIDNQVATLCNMLNDHQIVADKDLPAEVWQYLKDEGFFALIIPPQYGGRGFSAYGNSTIVAKIASCSLSAAVTVMVPNSLGPGELLMHYGTPEQQDHWLPKLAKGEELPCFALTGVDAGSDAGAITDFGIVCKKRYKNKMTVGIKLNWNKRYITLAPVASVLGLAFKLYDPDGLLGEQKSLGICCALIPTNHKGVEVGKRHNPMGMAFMNGPTRGEDVFIPLDWLIGGEQYIGKGWRMLVECLSAGRGISLPALASASSQLSCRAVSGYANIRKQFGLPIAKFEGVTESMARIAGLSYLLEGARKLTTTGLDLKLSPAIVTAIAKYHMTELSRQIVNDAFDIQGGKAIQTGPNNSLAHAYMGMPISITVEGANILTRNLMIFGQGATRCHPFVLKEMACVEIDDKNRAIDEFDKLLCQHILFTIRNGFYAFGSSLTFNLFAAKPIAGPTAHYYQKLSQLSSALAFCADIAMLTLGGELKRKESTSARLGDVLSNLYLASACLKRYEDDGRQQADLAFVEYGVEHCLKEISKAFNAFFANFKFGWLVKRMVFPFGIHYQGPSDECAAVCVDLLSTNKVLRERLCHLSLVTETGPLAQQEQFIKLMAEHKRLFAKFDKWLKQQAEPALSFNRLNAIDAAVEEAVFDGTAAEILKQLETLRLAVINVDEFENL